MGGFWFPFHSILFYVTFNRFLTIYFQGLQLLEDQTLGNRAIVVDEPGVTRDCLYGRFFWGEYKFMVVDTGVVLNIATSQADVMEELAITATIGMVGIPLASREAAVARMPSMIERQATTAVEEASVIIFLVDGQAGLTAADEEIGDRPRKIYSNKTHASIRVLVLGAAIRPPTFVFFVNDVKLFPETAIWRSNYIQMQGLLVLQFVFFGAADEKWKKMKVGSSLIVISMVELQGYNRISCHVIANWNWLHE
ncbi:hypothetical protein CMV_004180 [Castanea mollissima]|uniref:G domain-containing protein n=1 Tax=Castanea mollissima TaxID=60419 RepID=A0A8J4RG25_9ROSI|nr:hypothetical protein CMV_004180 [Castanea mollissima]